MPYDNDYNARIAQELGRSNKRFADFHAFDNIVSRGGAMGSGYGHFQLGNASKQDGLDGMYNNDLVLPKAYYGLEGGSGFAEGSFRDTGYDRVMGAGKGMKEYDKNCEGGNIFHDIWDGIKAVPDSLKSLPNALLNEAKKLKSAVGLGKITQSGKKALKSVLAKHGGAMPLAKEKVARRIGGRKKGGAFLDSLADWGKKQLKEQGDNTYAKAGLQGIQDLGYGMRGGTLLGSPDRPKEIMGYGKMDEEIKKAVAKKLKGKGKSNLVVKSEMPASSMSGFGKGDGRKKRAEIVKKVMAEKGLKMIEASKYVKQHGLYKP
jgi:hypothetical protein